MNTSRFLDALRARPDLPLAFSTQAGAVPAGFHLTEVKRVAHETVDCGSVTHRWIENQFELWTPSDAGPDRRAMPAGKFLAIVEKVRRILALDESAEARVFGRVAGGTDQLHEIESVETGADLIRVRLEPVSASCKARDRRMAAVPGSDERCCSGGSDSTAGGGSCCDSRESGQDAAKPEAPAKTHDTWFTPFQSPGFRFMF